MAFYQNNKTKDIYRTWDESVENATNGFEGKLMAYYSNLQGKKYTRELEEFKSKFTKIYRVIDNPEGKHYTAHVTLYISFEIARKIYDAYEALYGKSQSMDTREERGCICYTSEIKLWKEKGLLDKDFNVHDHNLLKNDI